MLRNGKKKQNSHPVGMIGQQRCQSSSIPPSIPPSLPARLLFHVLSAQSCCDWAAAGKIPLSALAACARNGCASQTCDFIPPLLDSSVSFDSDCNRVQMQQTVLIGPGAS